MNNVLTLSGVTKAYHKGRDNEISILNDLNFNLVKGEVVGLVAPSGAGKSTLLHIAGLLDTADAGTVTVDGIEQTGLSDRVLTRTRRQTIGFVYQFHHLLPEFSAAENIILPQMANGVDRTSAAARADELLDRVGLSKRGAHRPAELSGGEQQRVAFCRAMANAPKILLADEPTGNLDPTTSDTVFSVLIDLVKETGLSALIATHNLELAKRMDRMVRLDDGKLI